MHLCKIQIYKKHRICKKCDMCDMQKSIGYPIYIYKLHLFNYVYKNLILHKL